MTMVEHAHLNIPLKHTPVLCSLMYFMGWTHLSTLWAGHIFPLKQPYFYTHVQSLWCPWNEPYNLITMQKKSCIFVLLPGSALFSKIEREATTSCSQFFISTFVTLQTCPQAFPDWAELSLFNLCSWKKSFSVLLITIFPLFFCCILPDTHGTHRDSQWHNDLSGLFLIPFPIFFNNLSGIFLLPLTNKLKSSYPQSEDLFAEQ